MQLYKLTEEYQGAFNVLHERLERGEIDEQTMLDTLESLSGDIEEKSINLASYIKNIEALSYAIREEELRLAERRRVLRKYISRLKNYLLTSMRRCNMPNIESARFKISRRKNPPAVFLIGDVPHDFMKIKWTKEPDKTAIKNAIQRGDKIDFAVLEQQERLEIK